MKVNRRGFMALGGIAAVGAAGATYWWRNAMPDRPRLKTGLSGKRPNILLIVTDQERARHLIPESVSLPQRDRLMAQSTIFRNATAVANLCTLSRGTIYSGQHPQQNGVWENTPLPYARAMFRSIPTLGTLMQDCGYATGYFGKWHLSKLPMHQEVGTAEMAKLFREYGFEASNQSRECDGAQNGFSNDGHTAETAASFIHTAKEDERPWFAAVNFVNPHDVMFYSTGPEQVASRMSQYPDRIYPAPEDPIYSKDHGLGLPENFGPATLAGKPEAQTEFQKVMAASLGEIPFEDKAGWAALWNYYLNCLRDVDRHLGTVMAALEQSGQLDNTIIIYTADHGEMAGVHGLRDKGGNLYREAANVPMWISHPDVEGGSTTEALVSPVDIAPTLLSFAGMKHEAVAEQAPYLIGKDMGRGLGQAADRSTNGTGRTGVVQQWTSLVHLSVDAAYAFTDAKNASALGKIPALADDRIWGGFDKRGHMRGVSDGRYKFARYFAPKEHHTPTTWTQLTALNDLELYDTEADPMENTNLAADPETHREKILEMNAHLNTLIAEEIGRDDGSNYPGLASFWRLDEGDMPA